MRFEKPPQYVLVSALASLGGLVWGTDTGIIGPSTVMPAFAADLLPNGQLSATLHGLIVSAILIPAALTSFFGGRLADKLGRPQAMAVGSAIFALGAALEAGAVNLGMFIAGRVIEGLGEGLYLGTVTLYVCEITPPATRGALACGPQLAITLGLVVGFFTCYGTQRLGATDSRSWRVPFAMLAALAGAFTLLCLTVLPPSPRWLTLRGRRVDAVRAWDRLEVSLADREKAEDSLDPPGAAVSVRAGSSGEAEGVDALRLVEPRSVTATASGSESMWRFFTSGTRTQLGIAMFLMAMQQLSGIDGVLYYAPLLFQQAGLASSEASFLASGVSALLIFLTTIPALFLFERWTRRASIILGGLGIASTMLLLGSLYASSAHNTAGGRWTAIVALYVFAFVFSLSWAVSIKVYAAEIQPPRTRAAANGLAYGANWITNFAVALATPKLLDQGAGAAYWLFGGCSFLTAVVAWGFLPETRGRSLDEIDAAFKRSRVGGGSASGVQRGWREMRRRAGEGVRRALGRAGPVTSAEA